MLDNNEQVIRELFDSWGSGAVHAACERHLAEDARWLNSGLPDFVGKSACLAFAETAAGHYPVMKVDILSLAVSGDAVLVERVDRLFPADGSAPVDVEVAGSFRLRDGKIHYWHDYYDPRPFVGTSDG